MRKSVSALASLLLLAGGCGGDPPRNGVSVLSIDWLPVESSDSLPDGLQVFEGTDEDLPLKAWMAKVDLSNPDIDVEVLSSHDSDGRQSAADFQTESGACLVVNGGYFRAADDLFEHIGLLIADGDFIQFATPGIYRDDIRYHVFRAAIGFTAANEGKTGWVSSRKDSVFIWDNPIQNSPGHAADLPPDEEGHLWNVTDAISGGPALLKGGANRITVDEEVFFGTAIPHIHPRTAAGLGADGELYLLVVDGRQRMSRGVSLSELAAIMKSIGAVDAINLDGGGSSTMTLNGELLNRPTGGIFQREIVSALAINCN